MKKQWIRKEEEEEGKWLITAASEPGASAHYSTEHEHEIHLKPQTPPANAWTQVTHTEVCVSNEGMKTGMELRRGQIRGRRTDPRQVKVIDGRCCRNPLINNNYLAIKQKKREILKSGPCWSGFPRMHLWSWTRPGHSKGASGNQPGGENSQRL